MKMSPNRIARYLGKPPGDFTREDLIRFIEQNNVEMVNFRYVGGDGRLKTLSFVVTSRTQLDRLLSAGERVDGSSLFSYMDAASSDLYVIPRYRTAYVNPFSTIPTVDILCSYYTSEGIRLASSPESILRKAHEVLKHSTGLSFEAMGELEYYVLHDREHLYPMSAQRGYQESSPFSKWEKVRLEAMHTIAQAGGEVKYGHSEVGHIDGEDLEMEQHEIEFLPVPVEDAADQIVVARWVLRNVGYKYGVAISFAPKISVGNAGSGLHVHTRLVEDGKNVMIEGNGLSSVARKTVAGYLSLASSLTAFGNTLPISYLRLASHQEAPANICWGDRNRSVLVRVPLSWLNIKDMVRDANPQEREGLTELDHLQTIEFRCSDGSAHIHLLLAGLVVAARHGLEMKEALELANELYVDVDIFSSGHKNIRKRLPQLPGSCWESAESLVENRGIYERNGVFPPLVIDGIVRTLRSYNDKGLSKKLCGREDEIKKLVHEYLYCQ